MKIFVLLTIATLLPNIAISATQIGVERTVVVDFGISMQFSQEQGLQNLGFTIPKKITHDQAQELAKNMCHTYATWLEAGTLSSPIQYESAVFVVLLEKNQNGKLANTELVKGSSFSRTKNPFKNLYTPFESSEECKNKIAPLILDYSSSL